jgi:hypothetical protein
MAEFNRNLSEGGRRDSNGERRFSRRFSDIVSNNIKTFIPKDIIKINIYR